MIMWMMSLQQPQATFEIAALRTNNFPDFQGFS
jgi:hypothetical protein